MNAVTEALLPCFPHLVPIPVPSKLRNMKGEKDFCYRDNELHGALGCTAEEGYLLNRAVFHAQPRAMLEIGSYVGWSSAHLLYGNEARLTCVDPFIEDSGSLVATPKFEVMHRFRDNLWRAGVAYRVSLWMERSPEILAFIAPKGGWDFVFIDGWHFDNQPTHDVLGVFPYLADNAVVWMHDFWMADVVDAGRRLSVAGWNGTEIGTANRLAAFWKKEPSWWKQFMEEEVWV